LFAGSSEGADASALFYSLIETAKLNNLNPEKYFYFLLEKIIHVKEQDELPGFTAKQGQPGNN